MSPLLEWDPNSRGARLRLRYWIEADASGYWDVCDAEGSKRLAQGQSRGGLKGAKRCALKAAERLVAAETGAGAHAKGEQR